ncbi:MFS-type transporter SLC18B1-like [Amphibalanus amphitrite]|uniref:MFS-type transporter SLC18B1-like n=1 Tax=Amphibalanus amphitrite TaxID=1232801 RepID=UPI001C90BBC5|nr:MFS-type transporter SLC18B1-like [Amphibalanus amphitrite]
MRVAEAVGTAAVLTAGRTIIINQFPQRMNLAVSLVEGMYGGGLCLGPAIGGVLYSAGGYGAPFYVLGALLMGNAAASLLLMPTVTDYSVEQVEEEGEVSHLRDRLRLVLSSADTWFIFTALFLNGVNWTAVDLNIEPYTLHTLDMQPDELSLFFLGSFAGYTLSSPLWGRLSDYIDNTFLLEACCLSPTALGILLIPPSPLLGLRPSRLLLGVGMTLREVFQVGAYVPLLPLAVRLSTARGLQSDVRAQALVTSLCGAAYSFGSMTGPMGGGLVTDRWGFPVLATGLGGVTVLLCLAMAVRGVVYHAARRAAPAAAP